MLEAFNVPVLAVEGYEADDVIATLATRAQAEGFDVAIITGDRDAFQLVDDHVTVLYPKKGVSDLARMDPACSRRQVRPSARVATRTLRPCAATRATTCPGIPGVGEKTAAKWIREYGSLDDARPTCRRGSGEGRCRAA